MSDKKTKKTPDDLVPPPLPDDEKDENTVHLGQVEILCIYELIGASFQKGGLITGDSAAIYGQIYQKLKPMAEATKQMIQKQKE